MGVHTSAYGGVGYVDGQLKPCVMEMALGKHKVIDLTFRKLKSHANEFISLYVEIHSLKKKDFEIKGFFF